MGYEHVDEPVQVGVVFRNNVVSPKWFVWNNRKYPVKEVTYIWHIRRGEAPLLYFSVTDGTNLYELSFNQKTLQWYLSKVYVD